MVEFFVIIVIVIAILYLLYRDYIYEMEISDLKKQISDLIKCLNNSPSDTENE